MGGDRIVDFCVFVFCVVVLKSCAFIHWYSLLSVPHTPFHPSDNAHLLLLLLRLLPSLSLSLSLLQDAESHRRSREAVLLELLGEKEETIEELVEDMKTVKHMYVRLVGREEGEKRRLRS